MGKKVYNKSKRTNYKGSLPGMRAGGSLSKAQENLPPAQTEEELRNQILNQENILKNVYSKSDSLQGVRLNVADSLHRDQALKERLKMLQTEAGDWGQDEKWYQLQIDCLRGNQDACNQMGDAGKSENRQYLMDEIYNQADDERRGTTGYWTTGEGFQNPYQSEPLKKQSAIDQQEYLDELNIQKKGGTILGGKYKKGGSVKAKGRNGVL